MLPESRIVARLLLEGGTRQVLDQAIRVDNVLQKSSPTTAIRQARLIRLRLQSIAPNTWTLIAEGDKEVATQLLFAAALKHSLLLTDFVRDVVADHVRRLEQTLSVRTWESFLAECAIRDAGVALWSMSTRHKLLQVMVRILAEARYLQSTRSLRLLPPHINQTVRRTLVELGEHELLQTMELHA